MSVAGSASGLIVTLALSLTDRLGALAALPRRPMPESDAVSDLKN
jgi:hypothetical protein